MQVEMAMLLTVKQKVLKEENPLLTEECIVDFQFLIYLFIFAAAESSLLNMGFLVVVSWGYCCSLQCKGISLWWLPCGAQVPGVWASAVVAHRPSSCDLWAPEHRLSSCGQRAQLFRCMWSLFGPGIELVSSVLAGEFLSTGPPGKSSDFLVFNSLFIIMKILRIAL